MAKTTPTRLPSWLRRVVPSGYEQATLILTGTAPLLMSCSAYDRAGATYRSYVMLGKKRGKSIDDEQRLSELEWTLRLYFDDEIGPHIPGRNIKELLRESATKWRKGEELKRSLAVIDYRIPLLYDGPREPKQLWAEGYRYDAMASNSGAGSGRVVRCRPMFDDWSLVVELAYDPEDLDYDLLELVVERSMKFGLGDYRPAKGGDFGTFDAQLERGELHKLGSNGDALKARDAKALKAHLAFVERITTQAPPVEEAAVA
jgi:hypothetical protein